MTDAFLVLAGFLFGLSFLGGVYLFAIPVGAICLFLGWLNRPQGSFQHRVTEKIEKIVRPQPVGTRFEVETEPTEYNQPFTHQDRRKLVTEVESELDACLYEVLQVLKALSPDVNTAAVFFPSRVAGQLELRAFASESESVIEKVALTASHGLVGQLMKNDCARILEGDLAGGRTLYYYNDDAPVRSIAGVPIIVRQRRRGCVVVDSRKTNAFDQATISVLKGFALVVGTLTYKSYLNMENHTQKEQLRSLYHYQRKFFHTMSVKDIHRHIADYIKGALPFDRLMVLSLEAGTAGKGRVVLAEGLDADFFSNQEFSLDDKGFLSIAFTRNHPLSRSFAPNEDYVWRVRNDEKANLAFRCILAVPVVSEGEKPELVIAVESTRHGRYTELHQDLLTSVANAAGFALGRARAFEEKQDLASRDGLTGLINHRTFQEKLRVEKLRADRMGLNIGLLMTDIDKFKSVNDTYGHPAGDQVIRGIAAVLNREVRSEIDVVARYGGEEFVVMLLDTNPETLRDTCERIRRAVETREFDIGRADPLRVTISVGAFLVKPEFRDIRQALANADAALYKSKNNGRNKVTEFT